MKRIVITMLVLLVSLVAVMASDGIEVGARVGYDMETYLGEMAGGKTRATYSGIAVMGTFDYRIKDSWGVKAAIGVTLNNNAVLQAKSDYEKSWTKVSEAKVPLQIKAYIAPTYCFAVNDKLDIDTAIGLNVAIGKMSKAESAKSATRLGLGIEAQVTYEPLDNLEIFGGANMAMFMYNSNLTGSLIPEPKTMIDTAFFAGASYGF